MEAPVERQHWLAVLAHSSPSQLLAHWPENLHPHYQLLRAPETGLTRLQGRMGGTGKRFILGDTTVTRAVVRLDNGVCGYSYILGRDKAHAERCALLDALLQGDDAGALHQQIIAPLAALREEQQALRAREVATSRVDFFTLVRGDNL